jgi:nitrogen fixation protein NifB
MPVPPPSTASGSPGPEEPGCTSTAGCGPSSQGLDVATREKVAKHPCYSQEAHQHYARMHLAVAPACNLQCNYCNRKHDCANESRPGVTSALLTPEDAARKVIHVANEIKALSVVGIAGPGDPLANPARTFRTFDLISGSCPDLTLCLSTNGLALPDHVERITDLGIDHVTVTVNMIDPEVGQRIYPWVLFNRRRREGPDAAKILSERQLAGIEALTSAGVLCKINSVMIPGINDEHLIDVSRRVKDLGAFTHNVMPLISAPEHGTVFGLAGQRGPTPQEVAALHAACERDAGAEMSMMRHCRQCRADAVGLLGEDRSEEFADLPLDPRPVYDLEGRVTHHAEIEGWREEVRVANESQVVETAGAGRADGRVLVAVATRGAGVVNDHFGHAEELWIYEAGPGLARFVQVRSIDRYCTGPSDCGDGDTTIDRTVRLLSDCAAVICAEMGHRPRQALEAAGIETIETCELIETAVAGFGARLAARKVTA